MVIFALISGRLPWSDDDRARAREICSATYSLLGTPWTSISLEAKSFISELIQVDPSRRLSAEKALYHDWFDPISHLRDRYVRDAGTEDDMEVAPAASGRNGASQVLPTGPVHGVSFGDMPPPQTTVSKANDGKRGGKGQKRRQNPVQHGVDEVENGAHGGCDSQGMEIAVTVVTNSAGKGATVTPRKRVKATVDRFCDGDSHSVITELAPPVAAPKERRSTRKK